LRKATSPWRGLLDRDVTLRAFRATTHASARRDGLAPRLLRTLQAMTFLFVIQACAGAVPPAPLFMPPAIPMGPGPAPPMNAGFDAYRFCIQGKFTDAGRAECFNETIQVNHLTLPAGTTAEQAYAKYKDCVKENVPIEVAVGPWVFNGNKANSAGQNCFTSALQ